MKISLARDLIHRGLGHDFRNLSLIIGFGKPTGATIETWTRDLILTMDALYQLSYGGLWNKLAHYMVDQENSSFCELDFFIGLGDEFFSEKFIQFFSIDSAFFYIISICSESEHHLFDLYLFTCEYFFIVYFSSEVSGKWRSIVPSCSCLIARSRKSKSSIWWVIPIWLIVFAFISWTWEIREFIVMPVFSLKISQNLQKFFFYFSFRKGICFPVFWIFFIFEYIGASMADASELCV